MKSTINLALKRQGVNKQLRKIFIVSFGIFGVIFVVTLGVILYNFYLNSTFEQLVVREDELNQQISRLADKKTNLVQLHDRLTTVNTALTNRKDLATRLTVVSDLLPAEIDITDVEAKEELFTIRLTTQDLNAADQFVDRLYYFEDEKDAVAQLKGLNRIDLVSFDIQPNSESDYVISLDFNY